MLILAVVTSYLLGSLPWGLWLTRLRGVDVRRVGSGNLGATNVARAAGYRWAAVVLLLDAAKGALAVALGRALSGGGAEAPFLPALCGVLAVLGHATTPWAGFRGGKGVATGAGTAAVLMPLPFVAALLVFGAVLAAGRIVSLASVLAALALAPAAWILLPESPERPWLLAWAVAVALVIVVRHAGNLRRLLRGREPRLGRRSHRHEEGALRESS
ncbi:MAG: glycerol-3-phosphate 1-O-acyltransferase PlsY [Candidatus Eisenbacteria bacterium]|nr:glycerol-3-phosphate 1-O-acyltransferase PlsY [Candidatus Eisenbacteria bacterium]